MMGPRFTRPRSPITFHEVSEAADLPLMRLHDLRHARRA
jgi:hypothetical protein